MHHLQKQRERTNKHFPRSKSIGNRSEHFHISKRFIHEAADWESFLFSDGQSSCNLHLQADPHHITNINTSINITNITTFVINEKRKRKTWIIFREGRRESLRWSGTGGTSGSASCSSTHTECLRCLAKTIDEDGGGDADGDGRWWCQCWCWYRCRCQSQSQLKYCSNLNLKLTRLPIELSAKKWSHDVRFGRLPECYIRATMLWAPRLGKLFALEYL